MQEESPRPLPILPPMLVSRLLAVPALGSLCLAQVPIVHVVVDSSGPSDMHVKSTGDLNGDGFVDLVAAGKAGALNWYEDRSAQGGAWTRHVIATPASGLGGWSTDAECGDLDGDGDEDLVISDWYQHQRVVWFENLGAGASFRLHVIGAPRAHDLELADLDLDGDLDLAARRQGAQGGTVELWRNDGAGAAWSHDTLPLPALGAGEGLFAGDVDGDGDPDLVLGRAWYENPGAPLPAAGWSEHVYAPSWGPVATAAALADLDGDGRVDVVLTPNEAAGGQGKTSWFEAPADATVVPWTEHVIAAGIETVTHSLAVGDVDLDGDVDVVTAEMHQGANPDEVRLYSNDGAGVAWTLQVVSGGGSHSLRLVDVGGDGDLDLFGANWTGTTQVDLWENELRTAWLGEPLCFEAAACPCGNGAGPGQGCANSTGAGGVLLGAGSVQLALDDLTLVASGLPAATPGLVLMGDAQGAQTIGAGRLCAGGALFRFPVRLSSAQGVLVEGPGLAAFAQLHFASAGQLMPGATWTFQTWYRDPGGPCGQASNFSAALALTFEP